MSGDGQGFDFAIQRALSQSAVSAWVCLILVESAKPGVILGRKVKKPDIRLCHARPKNLRSLGCKSVQVQAAASLFGDFNHYPAI